MSKLIFFPNSNYVEITLDKDGLLQFMELLRSKKGYHIGYDKCPLFGGETCPKGDLFRY